MADDTPAERTSVTQDWRAVAMVLISLVGAAGGGIGLGSQIQGSDQPEVVIYRLSRMEIAVEALATEVRTLGGRSADRWSRSQHEVYAREVDARLDQLERNR